MSTSSVNIEWPTASFGQRTLGEFLAARQRYSQLHEQSHVVLTAPTGSGKTFAVYQMLLYFACTPDLLTDWPTVFLKNVVQGTRTALAQFAKLRSAHRLPAWNTHAFAGLPTDTWAAPGHASPSVNPAFPIGGLAASLPAPAQVVIHLHVGTRTLLVDGWAAMVRVIDSVLMLLRLMRLLVHSGLRCRANIGSFVLVILAACRRYGRRSEPDDHASLFTRQKLVSMGSYALAC